MPGKPTFVRLFIVTAIAALFAASCSKPGDQVVLKVDDQYTVTLDEYKSLAAKRFNSPEIAATEPLKSHEAYLNEILVRDLKVIDGRNKGFANDPDIQQTYDDALQRAAITKLYNEEVLDKVVPESEMKAFYKSDNEEVHASHILLRIQDGTDTVAVKARIDSLYNLASAGADFAELAKKYSEDPSTPDGDIGWFRRGVMVKPFEDAAFSLKPGDVSKPVRTSYGWHIIKMHERRPVKDRPSFEEDKNRIAQMLMRQRSDQLVARANAYIDQIEKNRQMTIDTAAVKNVVDKVKAHLNTADIFGVLNEDELKTPLLTLDGGDVAITPADLRGYVARRLGRNARIDSEDTLIQVLKNYTAENYLLPDQAKKDGYYEDETVKKAARDAADRKIYAKVQDSLVDQEVNPTDDQVRAYFDAHPNKYMTEAQYTLVECLVGDKKLATEIYQRASKGESLRDLAAKYSKRISAKKKNGVFGPIRRSQYGAIGRLASEANIGDLVGPVKVGQDWSVFRVISKEDPRPEDFDQVKQRVKTDLRREMRQQVEDAWVDSLKQAVDYSINMDVIARAYPNAKADDAKSDS